jgi:hypothetical protein
MEQSMKFRTGFAAGLAAVALALGGASPADAQSAKAAYPAMAPIAQYQAPSQAAEIALARSAAPPAISADATVMILGAHGYETAVKGKNGFVCIVQRAWADGFEDPEFWNPKPRDPLCLNAAAARSVLPTYLKRTEWVLAGVPKAEIVKRTKAAIADKTIPQPETGAMTYMMSKDGYLNDGAGHWHPHVMFYLPVTEAAAWGANVKGGPVMGGGAGDEPGTVFFVLVPTWSDGTPAMDMKM